MYKVQRKIIIVREKNSIENIHIGKLTKTKYKHKIKSTWTTKGNNNESKCEDSFVSIRSFKIDKKNMKFIRILNVWFMQRIFSSLYSYNLYLLSALESEGEHFHFHTKWYSNQDCGFFYLAINSQYLCVYKLWR